MTAEGIALPDVAIPIGTQAQADKQFGQGSHLALHVRGVLRQQLRARGLGPAGRRASWRHRCNRHDHRYAGRRRPRGRHHPSLHRRPACAGEHRAQPIPSTKSTWRSSAAINENFDLPVIFGRRSDRRDVDVQLERHQRQRHRHARQLLRPHRQRGACRRASPSPTLRWACCQAALACRTSTPRSPILASAASNTSRMPFTDTTSLMAWELEYGFTDTGRWGWMRQLYGHIFSAKRADLCQPDRVRRDPQRRHRFDHGRRAG